MSLHYYSTNIVFQEVPEEVSLCFSMIGCGGKCKGCHSPHLHHVDGTSKRLDADAFISEVLKVRPYITCVLFLGGEWDETELSNLLHIAVGGFKLKTCLYSNKDSIPESILPLLDYYKVGPFIEEFGGLNNIHTNQRFFNSSGECLNYKFQKGLK